MAMGVLNSGLIPGIATSGAPILLLPPMMTVDAGTWGFNVSGACWFYGNWWNNSRASGDQLSTNVFLQAGTWAIDVFGEVLPSAGILKFKLDGADQGVTIDFYAAGGAGNVLKTTTITVSTSGSHTFAVYCNSKNASSSGYDQQLQAIQLRRTA